MPKAEESLPKEEKNPIEVLPSKELKILYSWKAPARPFKKRDKEFWKTVVTILVLVCLILFFVREWFLIAALVALMFVYYVLSTVEPEEMECKITNRGILYAGENYPFEEVSQFWFSEKYRQRVINFELKGGRLLGRLTILVGKGEEQKMREILLKYLVEEEAPAGFLDKAGKWLEKRVSLESDKPPKPNSTAVSSK